VTESGKSSFNYLQNICTYRDPADQPVGVALAVAEHLLDGAGAFRVHGGGFAGTIQAFVPLDRVASFKAGMDALLGEGACQVLFIRPVGGCVIAD
ncbi:MAG: galactokinase, partial [Lachnospiraceae bacterium]|nr:galactokinase [Lachnospiraceae bacterium]